MSGFHLQLGVLLFILFLECFFISIFLLRSFFKTCSLEDSDDVRRFDDQEFQNFTARKQELPQVQEASDHITATRVFNLSNKCGQIPFCSDDDEFIKVRKEFLDQICYDRRRVFFLCNTDNNLLAFVRLRKFQNNIWQIASFGIDPAGLDARIPFELRNFRPIRIIIDSISVKYFPSSHIFMEIYRADYESRAVLEFCGFEEMENPPFENNNIDKIVFILNKNLLRENKKL